MAKKNRLAQVFAALQKEEGVLDAQLGKIRDALAALGDVARDYRVRQGARKAKTVARNVRKMSTAQRKAAAVRMKAYWAARRRKAE